jgi:hypothetical protein
MSRLTVPLALFPLFVAMLLIACSGNRGTACDNLVYKEEGLTRSEFLPCAAEMITIIDKLDAHMDAVLKGDERARAEARVQYDELGVLIKKAGGRNLVGRWQDDSLNRLNVRIWNAYTSYAFHTTARASELYYSALPFRYSISRSSVSGELI